MEREKVSRGGGKKGETRKQRAFKYSETSKKRPLAAPIRGKHGTALMDNRSSGKHKRIVVSERGADRLLKEEKGPITKGPKRQNGKGGAGKTSVGESAE